MSATLAFIIKGLINVLIVWIILVAVMFLMQRHLVFHPTAKGPTPKELGMEGFEEIQIRTSDNLMLNAWFHKSKKNDKAIVYFYGNADRLTAYPEFFKKFSDAGYTVLGMNYRGYGGSEGRPSEQGLYLDGHAAMDFLKYHGLDSKNIIVAGRSMGTGVASQLAQDYELGGIVLISPYTSLKKLGAEIYWYLPVKYVGRYNFHSIDKYGENQAPVLIIHGDKDGLIPYRHSEDLLKVVTSRKELVKYEGADHIDLDLYRMADDIIRFFNANQ